MRFEKQDAFDVSRRLNTWAKNKVKFSNTATVDTGNLNDSDPEATSKRFNIIEQ